MSPVLPALSVGQLIGNYRVAGRLAEGGMGEVYEVVHTTLGRRAALKVIHPSLAQDATVVARFLREAQATNQVRHPGVVQIFEYGQLPERHGVPYFVMEFLEGETLSKCIRRAAARHGGRLGLSCLRLLQQVAKTLAAVHSQGLVHRDVKPANIMIISDPDVTDGKRIKLLDFGIVKILSSAGSATGKGYVGMTAGRTVLGTPEFMAPEQWTARDCVDGKADVYALGVISFLCFAGRLPFVAANYVALGLLHCQTRPPALSDLDLSVPSALSELVAGMLEKNPAHRPTMAVVEETMGRLLSLSHAPETLPSPSERYTLDISESAEPDTEVSSVVSTLQTYTWEEVELGIVGPSFEESLPGEPAVQVRVLSSLSQLPVGPSAKQTLLKEPPLLLAPPAGLSPRGVQVGNEAPDCTPQPSPFYFLQRSLMMGSRLSWPWYLLTAAVLVGVLWLLPRRPQRNHGEHPSSAGSERFVASPPSVSASVVALGTSSGTGDRRPTGDLNREPRSNLVPTPAVVSVLPDVEPEPASAPTVTAPRAHRHHRTRRSCERKFPTSSCIRNSEITLEQRMTLLRAFYSSNTKLCAHEHLVVSASPRWPSIQTVPAALSDSTQASLLVALRLLYRNQPIPASIDIRCPSDGLRPRPSK